MLDFAQRCIQIVQRYQFPPKLLILEVTESQSMSPAEQEQLRENIEAVRAQGMRVIFDDFGAGFSSFRDLQSYPMDGLKLDKELVDHMDTDQGRIILRALVEAGHRMGFTILAEGVENDSQIDTPAPAAVRRLPGLPLLRAPPRGRGPQAHHPGGPPGGLHPGPPAPPINSTLAAWYPRRLFPSCARPVLGLY